MRISIRLYKKKEKIKKMRRRLPNLKTNKINKNHR